MNSRFMKIFNVIFLFLLLTGCANTQSVETGKEIKLKDSDKFKYIGLTDIFHDQQPVCLETNDNCLLKSIQKIEVVDDFYYVLGGDTKTSVFVFDKTGHFIRKIGTQGHGKGEYLSAWDFTVDRENDRVAILSAPSRVYLYHKDGSFIKTCSLGNAYCWNITSMKNGFIGSTKHLTYTSGDDAFLLYFFDEDFKVRKKEIPVLPHQIYVPNFVSSVFIQDGEKKYYVDNFMNRIYDLAALDADDNNYQISFSNPMPSEKFETFETFSSSQRDFDFLKDVLLLGDKAIFVYIQNAQHCVETMNLSGKTIVQGCYSGNFPSMFSDGQGNVILCISAYSFLKKKMEDFLPELKGKVKPGDNYILVKCKLKDD